MATKIAKNSNFVGFFSQIEDGTRKLFIGYTAADLASAIIAGAEFFVPETEIGSALLGSPVYESVFAETVRIDPDHKRCNKCKGKGCFECKDTGITGPAVDDFTLTIANTATTEKIKVIVRKTSSPIRLVKAITKTSKTMTAPATFQTSAINDLNETTYISMVEKIAPVSAPVLSPVYFKHVVPQNTEPIEVKWVTVKKEKLEQGAFIF